MNRFLTGACLVAALLAAGTVLGREGAECPVTGERIHWIADYCMATLGTDDEIPAGPCVRKEYARRFKNDCVAKIYYKKSLCELAISRGRMTAGLSACLADSTFVGPTVRNDGVGGWQTDPAPPNTVTSDR